MRVTRFMVKLAGIVAPALALLLVAPSPAPAHGPKNPPAPPSFYAAAVGYEVAEHLRFKGGAGEPTDFKVRFAKATLLGQVVQAAPDAGNPFVVGGFFDADAKSFVKFTGKGPLVATFDTLQDFDPSTTSLSTMEVTATGTLEGELDLTPLMMTPPQPFAPTSGKWRIRHNLKGNFSGVFLVPFPGALIGAPVEFVYALGPLGAAGCRSGVILGEQFCAVHEDEILLGFPLTKLELVLFRD